MEREIGDGGDQGFRLGENEVVKELDDSSGGWGAQDFIP